MNLREKILSVLTAARSGHVSGAHLASRFHVSRTAIWKYVRSLEQIGYIIEAVPSKGYRLLAAPDALALDELQGTPAGGVIGHTIRFLPAAVSTNTVAMEMADQGAAEGTVVLAEQQSGGKGRLGRSWISPPGNLYLSVVLRPPIPTHKAPLLTLLGAAALCAAVRRHLRLPAGIKWPNDILLNGRKVAGILTEMSAEPDRVRHVVLGIGVNANMDLSLLPPDIRDASTTLAAAFGRKIDRTALLKQLFAELAERYRRFLRDPAAVLTDWRDLNVTLGNEVRVQAPDGSFAGRAENIDDDGRLIIRLPQGSSRAVASGDVTLLKEAAGAPALFGRTRDRK